MQRRPVSRIFFSSDICFTTGFFLMKQKASRKNLNGLNLFCCTGLLKRFLFPFLCLSFPSWERKKKIQLLHEGLYLFFLQISPETELSFLSASCRGALNTPWDSSLLLWVIKAYFTGDYMFKISSLVRQSTPYGTCDKVTAMQNQTSNPYVCAGVHSCEQRIF